mgnify:CR=1 FL=1
MKNLIITSLTISSFFSLCNSQNKEQQIKYQNDNLIKELGIGLIQQTDVTKKLHYIVILIVEKLKLKMLRLEKILFHY